MEAHRRVVRLSDDVILNRYWDDRDTPREEAYLEDVTTAKRGSRPAHEVYRDLRAAAESGWDFSSRWLRDPERLETICTTSILPVDLNCFLYKLEKKIADLHALVGDMKTYETFTGYALRRKHAISRFMWNEEAGSFHDFDWELQRLRSNLTAATITPLYTSLASPAQAGRVASMVLARLLRKQGIATTELKTGQQWDEPNGWAPLQWMAIQGLADYGMRDLAQQVAKRWLTAVAKLYQGEGKLVEKYAMRDASDGAPKGGGGGEYPLQDGFGWTNGVSRMLLQMYPEHIHGLDRQNAAVNE
jgi:alpha,alpha-trehalase